MKLANVYGKLDCVLERASGCSVWDTEGHELLDFYSGHGVISIGHRHPTFVRALQDQLDRLVYYSNAVHLREQQQLADRLGDVSGYTDDQLFLVNSGAEAVENALKVASFATGRHKIIAFHRAFHGRTSLAVQCSDNPQLQAPINKGLEVTFLPLNDLEALRDHIDNTTCAVIVEGIQGIGGIHLPTEEFLSTARNLTEQHGACLILDEVQSGFGRSGRFFAHQWSSVKPDIITMAKGMGNGFPVGGIIVSRDIPLTKNSLGTTFGGNPMACAACLAVLDVLVQEELMPRAMTLGQRLQDRLSQFPEVTDVRGRGLMIGLDLKSNSAPVRRTLLEQQRILVGSASSPETVRLLPPLNIEDSEIQIFLEGFEQALKSAQDGGTRS